MQDLCYNFSHPCCFSSGQSMKDEDRHSAKRNYIGCSAHTGLLQFEKHAIGIIE